MAASHFREPHGPLRSFYLHPGAGGGHSSEAGVHGVCLPRPFRVFQGPEVAVPRAEASRSLNVVSFGLGFGPQIRPVPTQEEVFGTV
ncbi:hypothetical protein MTO96_024812 [Rhipicephalus appendiculatus]